MKQIIEIIKWSAMITLFFGFYSCTSIDKITKNTSSVNIPFGDKHSLEVSLETIPGPLPDSFPKDANYMVVVYDEHGVYINQKPRNLVNGKINLTDGFSLTLGKEYTFLIFSYGSKEIEPIPSTMALNNIKISLKGYDFYYQIEKRAVSGTAQIISPIDISPKLLQKFTQITLAVNASELGNITDIKASFSPHYNSTDIALPEGKITVQDNTVSKAFEFDTKLLNTTNITSRPAVIYSDKEITNGKLSLTINGIQAEVSLSDFIFKPNRYKLNIIIKPNNDYLTYKNYPAVRIGGRVWMRHNLGADISLDPDQNPSVQGLHGNLYQWAKITPSAISSSSVPISGYNSSYPIPDKGWNSGTEEVPVKTSLDPCPDGYRIPTNTEWNSLKEAVNPPTYESIGNIQSGVNNFTSATVLVSKKNARVKLTFPNTWGLSYNGKVLTRGESTELWSSTNSASYGAYINNKDFHLGVQYRYNAHPIRCIAE
nr:FISUMP domain-containing protein [Elizabethkingia sp. ASV34]